MIHYIIKILSFQVLFLLVYDLFLKKETFFQWNRVYLIVTALLSVSLPFVKINTLSHVVPQSYMIMLPEVVIGNPSNEVLFLAETEQSWYWSVLVLLLGIVISLGFFFYKCWKLYRLRQTNISIKKSKYTQVVIANSKTVFSFLKTIFIGDQVLEKNHKDILEHELVHIQQRHSLDLLFFEGLKILFWWSPLVYIFQSRMAELHEYIADSKIVKDKINYSQFLLSELFNVEHIAFINTFYNKSLIKKRIVMLQKSKTKAIWQLKYLLLVPVILGMLVYSSCESTEGSETTEPDPQLLEGDVEYDNSITITGFKSSIENGEIVKNDNSNEAITKIEHKEDGVNELSKLMDAEDIQVPFSAVEETPIFPGCEELPEDERKNCFYEKMSKHIRLHFRYPEEAQSQGQQGRVSILFTIDTDGSIVDIRKRGPHESLEDEAVRIISKLPKMTPGKQKGKAVKVAFEQPITFRLQ